MSRRIQEDLDVRIRRAWPIDCHTTPSPPSATQRMRTRIDERIVGGAEPDASHSSAPSRRTVGSRSRRHVATVLAGAVVAASVLAVGGLVTGRLGQQNRPNPVEFADRPAPGVADEPATGVPEDPDAHVRTAIADTQRAAADLTVREALRQATGVDRRHLEDIAAFAEEATLDQESTAVSATNGDWSYTNQWDEQSESTPPIGAVRFVGGRYYERGPGGGPWEHVVTDDGQALSGIIRDGLAAGGYAGAKVLDGRTLLDLLEPYDTGWTVVPGDPEGATRYRLADTGKATRLAMELETTKPLTREAASDLPIVTEGETTTVDVWIDDESGLVQRVLAQRSAGPADRLWIMRRDLTLTQEDGSLVEAPEQASDVTLDEWCARDRAPIWRMAEGWQKVCGQS